MVSSVSLHSSDAVLADEVVRLASSVGVEVVVSGRPPGAEDWGAPELLLVGADLATATAACRLPPRSGVVLVGHSLDDSSALPGAYAVGAEHVALLPEAEPWLVDRLTATQRPPTGGAVIVAVLGGRGGAGASTLSCALAVTGARRGLSTMLVDGDPFGGGLDLLLGAEGLEGLRWPDVRGAEGYVPEVALLGRLPYVDGLLVLSCAGESPADIPGPAMRSVLEAGSRACDLLVVDLPRRPGPSSAVALRASTLALLVVPAEVRAAAAAVRTAHPLRELASDLRLVVRGPSPAGLDADTLARSLRLPLSGELRAEPGLDAALERGEPPARLGRGPLASYCTRLLDELRLPVGRAA